MSNRAIDAVRDFSQTKGSERLLLFMIAEGINKGTGYYEALISTLMADCNMSERWVQKLIVRLVEAGELIVFERTGHSSVFTIPIYEGEIGYAPEPCNSDLHLCLGQHTSLSVNRETIRKEDWSAQRRQQRTSRKVKSAKDVNEGVNDSTPPPETPQGGERECTPPRPIVHPRVNDSAPPGERECTQYPVLNPLVLPLDEPNARDTSPSENLDSEPDEPDEPDPRAVFDAAYPDVTAWARKTGRRWGTSSAENAAIKDAFWLAQDAADAAHRRWLATRSGDSARRAATG